MLLRHSLSPAMPRRSGVAIDQDAETVSLKTMVEAGWLAGWLAEGTAHSYVGLAASQGVGKAGFGRGRREGACRKQGERRIMGAVSTGVRPMVGATRACDHSFYPSAGPRTILPNDKLLLSRPLRAMDIHAMRCGSTPTM